MVRPTLARRAGDAVIWQGVQFGGVKLVDLIRIMVLARLLAPGDFGLFAVALVALDFLMSVTNFGMVQALVQRPEATRAHYESAWTINLGRSLLVGAGLALLAAPVANLFGEPDAAGLLRLLALRPVLEAAASIGIAELEKELRFRSLALLKLGQSMFNAVVSVALVAPLGVWALVAGPVAAAALYAALSYVVAPIPPRLRLRGAAAGHLARYGRWILVAAWIAVAGRTLLQLGVSRELGAVALGTYFLAAKLAFVPADVSALVVGSVAFPVFAKLQDDGQRTARTLRTVVLGLAAIVFPSSLMIIVLAPSLAADLLGERWLAAITLIQLLALKSILGILGDAVVPLFNGRGRPDWTALMELAHYGLVLPVAVVLGSRWGIAGVAAAWIPSVLASQVVGIHYLNRLLPRPLEGLLRPLGWVMATALLGALVAGLADRILGGAVGVILAAILGVAASCLALFGIESRVGLGFAGMAVQLFPWSQSALSRLGLGHRIPDEDPYGST